MSSKSVCVVTAGSIASTPRMLKSADTLHGAGYQVRVVCAEYADWCKPAEAQMRAHPRWALDIVRWQRATAPVRYFCSTLRERAAKQVVRCLGPRCAPLRILAAA